MAKPLGGQNQKIIIIIIKYRRYFNRSACVSVCLSVCFRKNYQKIGLVIIVYTPVLSTTGSYWLLLRSPRKISEPYDNPFWEN